MTKTMTADEAITDVKRRIADGRYTYSEAELQLTAEVERLRALEPVKVTTLIRSILAERLAELMTEISERCYCAGWMDGLERALYRVVFCEASRSFGMGEITQEQCDQLHAIATAADSWWYWDDGGGDIMKSGPTPISLSTAALLYGNELTSGDVP